MAMTTQQWTNRPVVDEHHEKVGKVTDVVFSDMGGDTPRWAMVKTGPLAERLTPLAGAYVSEDGTVVLPFDQSTVKSAPKVPRDHVLTPDMEQEACEHFDLT